jgi:hypothetical protein
LLWSFQQHDATYSGFEKFITEQNKMSIGKDTACYLVITPKMCASCNTQALRVLSTYAQGKPLYIFCDSNKQAAISGYIRHRNVRYINRFDYKWLSKQLFMRSGLAFASGSNHKLNYVDVINGSSLKKYE